MITLHRIDGRVIGVRLPAAATFDRKLPSVVTARYWATAKSPGFGGKIAYCVLEWPSRQSVMVNAGEVT